MSGKYKIVLLGEGRVGKTSLVRRYTADEFNEKQPSTVQANMYSSKKLQVEDHTATIAIWDTAGQERFHALGPIYYRDANGAVLVYDITDKDTFGKVKTWVKELRKVVGDDIRLAVAGNKADLASKRQVSEEEALRYCKELDAIHIHTSAKSGAGVEEIFTELTKAMVRQRSKGRGGAGSGRGGGHGGGILITEDEHGPTRPEKKKGCCGGHGGGI
eukprot:Hpha_TRINITY_DN25116_c0_g1::TRINITY_DN25116_c0_g1_i1::g.139323::m.139323/K07890/RAB21; Ras-related protein Rab-21